MDLNTISSGITNHLSGGPPEKQYMGGSQYELDQQRKQLGSGAQGAMYSGRQVTRAGNAGFGQANMFAAADRGVAQGMYNQGIGLGNSAIGAQNAYMAGATLNGPSAAEAQMREGVAQTQRGMLGQAAAARGGNQAAAMRNAQIAGSNMQLQMNQQAAILRAQEEQQRRQNMLAAAGMLGQRAGMGYGMAGQGLNASQQSTGMLGQFAGQQGNLGIAQQNVGLGSYGLLNDVNRAQLEADRANASATVIANSPAATFGSIFGGVSSMYGG